MKSQNISNLVLGIYLGFSILILGFLAPIALAQDSATYKLIEPLPGIQEVKDFPDFVTRFIPFLLAFAALAAFVQIVFGGILRATSGGNPSAIGDANDRIWMAILGLVLALSAYLILNTINPDLVSLRFFVPKVEIKAPELPPAPNPSQTRPGLNQQCSLNTGCEPPYECSFSRSTQSTTCIEPTTPIEGRPNLGQSCSPAIGCNPNRSPALICQQIGSGEDARFECVERTPLFGENHVCDPQAQPNGGCRPELRCRLGSTGQT